MAELQIISTEQSRLVLSLLGSPHLQLHALGHYSILKGGRAEWSLTRKRLALGSSGLPAAKELTNPP